MLHLVHQLVTYLKLFSFAENSYMLLLELTQMTAVNQNIKIAACKKTKQQANEMYVNKSFW